MYKYVLLLFLCGTSVLATDPDAIPGEDINVTRQQNQISVRAADDPDYLQSVLNSKNPSEKALYLHTFGRRLLNQDLYDKAYSLMSQIRVADLPDGHLEDFEFNLATLLILSPTSIPNKAPQQSLKEAWDIAKKHETSIVTRLKPFSQKLIDDGVTDPTEQQVKEVAAEMFKPRTLRDTLRLVDPEWGELYYGIFMKIVEHDEDKDYNTVLYTILQDIFNGDPNKKLYIPFLIVNNLFKDHPEMQRVKRARGMESARGDSLLDEDGLIRVKKKLDDNRAQFFDSMRARAVRFAIQEFKVIVEKDKEVQNTLLDPK